MNDQIQKKTVRSSDGVELYYEVYDAGNGAEKTPFFLIHGVGGDLDAWEFVRKEITIKGRACIAMDIRGHGKSGHPRTSSAYTLEHFISDAQAVLDAEQIEKCVLVGHSLGAVLAAQIALELKTRIEKLILISGSFQSPEYFKLPGMPALMKGLAALSLPPIKSGHSVYPAGKHHKDVEWLGLMRTVFRNSLRSYLMSSYYILKDDFRNRLSELAMPVLLITGTADTIFPKELSEIMHEHIQNSKITVIPGGNHVIILNNPHEVSEAIISFA